MNIDEYLGNYSSQWKTRALMRKPEMLDDLRSIYGDIPSDEIAYLYCNGMSSRPVCVNCGEPVSWFKNRYAKACSRQCAMKYRDPATLEKFRNAYSNPSKSKTTILERYGQHPNKGKKHIRTVEHKELILDRIRTTISNKYGVDNISQLDEIKLKKRKTKKSNEKLIKGRIKQRNIDRANMKIKNNECVVDVVDPDVTNGEANNRYQVECGTCGTTYLIPSETFKYRINNFNRTCSNCESFTARSCDEIAIASRFHFVDTCNRSLITPYELDMVDHTKKVAIEYCGLYWHSEKSGTGPKYHRNKYNKCEEIGYKLITVFEDEYKSNKELVNWMIGNALGLNDNSVRISARQCTVEIINPKIANIFLTTNHIQGKGRANIHYGLFYGDLLVSVMTFSNNDISRRSIGWGINRFCSLIGYNVRGAAGKMFSRFIQDNDPIKVVSYADLRWGTGNVYEKLGFVKIENTRPNYWYFKGIKRYRRYGLRKNDQDAAALTEWENRQEQGWNRIWDCGNAKWVWRPN